MRYVEFHRASGSSVLFIHGGNVAGWMWREQADALTDYHSIIPDLPGFGQSSGDHWGNLINVADQLAEIVRQHGHGGRAHVVGLSLGGVLGVVLAARHHDVIDSLFVTGAAIQGVDMVTRFTGLAQISLWGWRGYWAGLARVFRLPQDSIAEFVETGLGIDRDAAKRMMREVYDGVPHEVLDGLRQVKAPVLAIAGELEPQAVKTSLNEISRRITHATTRLAPRMHHVWSAEDPALFHRILKYWLDHREPSSELLIR